MTGYIEGKDKKQLLSGLLDVAEVGSRLHEQVKAGILVRCTEDLERVISEASRESSRLGRKIFWLNVVLSAATVVGAIATLVMALKP